jgi:nitrogen regulatory protein PII
MFLVLYVLNDPENLDTLLDAWEDVGVSGVTILLSKGLVRFRESGGVWREDFPLFPSFENFREHIENTNRTLFSIVEDEAVVERLVKATERVVGSLDQPGTGVMAVIPLARVYGLKKRA